MHTPNPHTATWRKSSFSAENGSCVEVAVAGSTVGVRDSKSIGAGHLTLTSARWTAFVGAVKDHELH